ncbi:unnamed protein product [Linum trigynum]|uniref:Uncharacterized protein n=1 Tax=Linum trigynum TaxID=586398 RepID=A0AAV2EN89_9ROSI
MESMTSQTSLTFLSSSPLFSAFNSSSTVEGDESSWLRLKLRAVEEGREIENESSSSPLFLSDPDSQFPKSKDATSESERCFEAEDGDKWFKGVGLSGLRNYMRQLRPVGGCSWRGS